MLICIVKTNVVSYIPFDKEEIGKVIDDINPGTNWFQFWRKKTWLPMIIISKRMFFEFTDHSILMILNQEQFGFNSVEKKLELARDLKFRNYLLF